MPTINLGPEYDASVRKALIDVLEDFGVKLEEPHCGMGGSQEIEQQTAILDRRRVQIHSETYMGVSLKGDAGTIERIAAEVRARLSA